MGIMTDNLYIMSSDAKESEKSLKTGVTRQIPITKKRPRQIELTISKQFGEDKNVTMEWHKEEEFAYLYEFLIHWWFGLKGKQHIWYKKDGHTEWFKVTKQQIWGAYGKAKQITKGKEKQYFDWINSLDTPYVATWETRNISKYGGKK